MGGIGGWGDQFSLYFVYTAVVGWVSAYLGE